MIEHFFVVDDSNFFINAKPGDLERKVREFFGDDAKFEGPRNPDGTPSMNLNGHSVDIYNITGKTFFANLASYPRTWDADINSNPKRRIIRIWINANGNEHAVYSALINAIGLFDEIAADITDKFGAPVYIQSIDANSDLVLAAYLLTSDKLTPIHFDHYQGRPVPTQFGIFVRQKNLHDVYRAISTGSASPLP